MGANGAGHEGLPHSAGERFRLARSRPGQIVIGGALARLGDEDRQTGVGNVLGDS